MTIQYFFGFGRGFKALTDEEINVHKAKEEQLVALAALATLPQGQILAANAKLKEYYEQCFNADGSIKYNFLPEYQDSGSRLRRIKETQADQTVSLANLQVAVILFFKNDRQLGRQILSRALEAINYCKIIVERQYDVYDGDCAPCVCSYAENLIYYAHSFGFHDLAFTIGASTYCPSINLNQPAPIEVLGYPFSEADGSDATIEKIQQSICSILEQNFMK